MALITRITRLFKADFNAVLDQIEEPEMLLKQAIRDMQDCLNEAEQAQKCRLFKKAELQSSIDEIELALERLNHELDICFESEKEDLARDLIRRKLESVRLSERVLSQLSTLDKEITTQQKLINENQTTLLSMRQKAELIVESTSNSFDNGLTTSSDWRARDSTVTDNDIAIAFLQEQKKRARS